MQIMQIVMQKVVLDHATAPPDVLTQPVPESVPEVEAEPVQVAPVSDPVPESA